MAGRLTTGELVMFLSYLVLFYTPVNQIHSVNHLLQHALAAGERVFEILDAKPAVLDQGTVQPQNPRLLGKVEWKTFYKQRRLLRPRRSIQTRKCHSRLQPTLSQNLRQGEVRQPVNIV